MPGFVARAKVHGLAARPTFYVRLAKSRIVGQPEVVARTGSAWITSGLLVIRQPIRTILKSCASYGHPTPGTGAVMVSTCLVRA